MCTVPTDAVDDGKTEQRSGTGMGTGDTQGAKDVSDELDDQDQLRTNDQKEEAEDQGRDQGSKGAQPLDESNRWDYADSSTVWCIPKFTLP